MVEIVEPVPGGIPYDSYEVAMQAAGNARIARADSDPVQALEVWPSLAAAELTFQCRDTMRNVPGDVVVHRWPGGTMYYTPAEAMLLGL